MDALTPKELSSAFVILIAGWMFLAFVIILMITFIRAQGKRIRKMQGAGLTQAQANQIRRIVRDAMAQKPDFRGNMNATGLMVSWCTSYFIEVSKLRNVEQFLNQAQQLLATAKEYEAGAHRVATREAELQAYKKDLSDSLSRMAKTFVEDLNERFGPTVAKLVQTEVTRHIGLLQTVGPQSDVPGTRKGLAPPANPPAVDVSDDHPTLNFHPDDDNARTLQREPVGDDGRETVPRLSSLERAQLSPSQPGYRVPGSGDRTGLMSQESLDDLAEKSRRGS